MKEYDTPEECKTPLSNCCGYPPLNEVQLCIGCKDHCGWYDESDYEIEELLQQHRENKQ